MLDPLTQCFDESLLAFYIDMLTYVSILAADTEKKLSVSVEINYSVKKLIGMCDVGTKIYFVVSVENIDEKSGLAEITILNSKKEVVALGRQSIGTVGDNRLLVDIYKRYMPDIVKLVEKPKL